MRSGISQSDPRRRIAVICASLSIFKALCHGVAAIAFLHLDGDVIGAGLQGLGTLIWVGRAIWELH